MRALAATALAACSLGVLAGCGGADSHHVATDDVCHQLSTDLAQTAQRQQPTKILGAVDQLKRLAATVHVDTADAADADLRAAGRKVVATINAELLDADSGKPSNAQPLSRRVQDVEQRLQPYCPSL